VFGKLRGFNQTAFACFIIGGILFCQRLLIVVDFVLALLFS
jgi:hypothetical protein